MKCALYAAWVLLTVAALFLPDPMARLACSIMLVALTHHLTSVPGPA